MGEGRLSPAFSREIRVNVCSFAYRRRPAARTVSLERSLMRRLLSGVCVVALLAGTTNLTLLPVPAQADTIWTGAADNNWNNAANWSNDLPVNNGGQTTTVVGAVTATVDGIDVTGSGRTWVGSSSSDGTLLVENGGTLAAGTFELFGTNGFNGTATVSGAGSEINSGGLFVGAYDGVGHIIVEDGGTLTSPYGYLSQYDGSLGTVTVTGSGSAWNSSGMVRVGGSEGNYNATGVLTIADEGVVNLTDDDLLVAYSAGSTGTLNIGAAEGDDAVAAGSLQARAVVFGAGDSTLVFNHTNADYTFSTPISGSGEVLHLAGTTTLSGTNTYTGGTTVEGGILRSGGASSFVPDSAYVVNGGTLDLNDFNLTMSELSGTGGTVDLGSAALEVDQDSDTSFAGIVTGTGSLTKSGTGTLALTGANTYTGGTTISAGTLQGNTTSLSGDIVNNAALAFDQVSDGTFADDISGTGSLSKSGAGVLTLSGTNTYTGGTTISAGTLQGNTTSLSGDIVNNAVLAFDQASDGTFSDDISGTGSLSKSGAGVLTLSGTNTYTGGTTISAGTLQGNTTSLSGDIVNNAVLAFDQASDGTFSDDISGTGSLSKSGAGVLTLSGTNTYTGGTTVEGGILRSGGASSFVPDSAYVVNGGTLDLNDFNLTMSELSGTGGTVDLGSAALEVDQDSDTSFAGIVTGTGSLTKSGTGTLALTGTNNYTGGTTISAGALQGNTTSLSGDIVNNAVLAFDQASDGTFSDDISGTGSLSKSGAGVLTLSGTNTYTGGTTISAGTLQGNTTSLSGDIVNNAVLAFDQASDGTFSDDISGTGSVSKSGAGALTLSGTNTHTGGTFITGGTLVGDTDSLSGVIELDGGDVIFDQSEDGEFVGEITEGNGNLTLRGLGGVAFNDVIVNADSMFVHSSGNIIDGADINLFSSLYVYNDGTDADLIIRDGARVTSEGSQIGNTADYDATVTVTGELTRWTLGGRGYINLGGQGAATLNVENGAQVEVTGYTTVESRNNGEAATLNVSGAGSRFTTTYNLVIGNQGTGHMNISDGGQVFSGAGWVGVNSPQTGIVNISGENSLWEIATDDLILGGSDDDHAGTGHITLSDGGTLRLLVPVDDSPGDSTLLAAMGETSMARINIGAAQNQDAVAAGILDVATLVLGEEAGVNAHLVFNHTDDDYEFDTAILGTGSIYVVSGVTTLTGDSGDFSGDIEISGGGSSLFVNGTLGGTLNMSGFSDQPSLLGGSGTLGHVNVSRGGALSPGNSIGTLTVDGDLDFGDLSTFWVEVNDGGDVAGINSDLLLVTGAATIDEGARVRVSPANGTDTGQTYAEETTYRILTASSVTGTFGSVDSDFAFLTPELSYDATNVYMTLAKTADFEEVAATGNQRNIARILENLGPLTSLYSQILSMDEDEARNALNALTGEAHASSFQSFFQGAGQVRQKILNRLQQLLGGFRTAQFSGYAPAAGDEVAASGEVWGQVFGGWGSSDGNSVSAGMDRDTYGFLAGIDRDIGQDTRIGIAAGYSRSSYDVSSLASSGQSDNLHLATYAGTKWAGFDFKGALSYGLQMSDSERNVVVGAIFNHLEADYNAHSFQGTLEVSRDFDVGPLVVAPFAGFSILHVETEGFTETGGPAALTMASTSNTFETSSLGLRFNHDISNVTLNGELGWRHMFGDVSPASTAAFASSPAQSFTVTGAPLARNVFVVGAGADVELDNGAMLMVGYAGEFSRDTRDHGLRAELRFSF